MTDVSSLVTMAWFIARRWAVSSFYPVDSARIRTLRARSCRLDKRRPALCQPLQIEHPADQVRFLLDPPSASSAESPESVPILGFAKQFFDELPTTLRELVAPAPYPHAHARVR